MQSEVTIILKAEDSTFRKEFNCYDTFSMKPDDPVLLMMIESAKKEFKVHPEEIKIRILVEWIE